MGMDVYGKNPASETGEYFRNNVWWWRPLADYCNFVAPEICVDCEHWHTNDGDGLGAEGAVKLSERLISSLQDGTAKSYVEIRNAELASLELEPCKFCNATGIRTDAVGKEHGMDKKVIKDNDHPRHGEVGWCNGCNGEGHNKNMATAYQLNEENIENFAAFLKDSGGFKIC